MNVDLKGLQKVGANENVTILRHPKGHIVRVAHGALSEALKKDLDALPHFAQGGMLDEEDEKTVKLNPVADMSVKSLTDMFMDTAKNAERDYAQAELDPNLFAAARGEVPYNPPSLAAQMDPTAAPAPSPASIPEAVPALQQPSALNDSASSAGSSMLQRGINKEISGINKEADAQIAQNEATAGVEAEGVAALKAIRDKHEQDKTKILNDRAALKQDLQSGQINAGRFLEQMTTGGKIGTALGLIVSGLGSGGARQENLAYKFLNDQIAQDVEAQKADLGRKQNLLSTNLQEYKDMQSATDMAKSDQMQITAAKLRQTAAETSSPIIKARALQAAGKLERDSSQLVDQVIQRRAMQAQVAGGQMTPENAIHTIITDDGDRKAAREELSNVHAYKEASRSVNDLFKSIEDIGVVGGNLPFSESKAKLSAVRSQINQVVRAGMKGQGAITDNEQKTIIDPNLPEAGDTKAQLKVKLNAIQNMMRNRVGTGTPTLKGYGINVDYEQPRRTTQEEKLVNWAKQNPKDPRSSKILERLGG